MLIALMVLSVAILAANFTRYEISLPVDYQHFLVPKGASVSQIGRQLADEGLVPNAKLFSLYARLLGLTEIKAGEYQLPAQLTQSELLTKLVAGEVITYQWTLIEGWNLEQLLASLNAQEKLNHSLQSVADINHLLERDDLPFDLSEGWFFPDTYHYHFGDNDKELLLRAYRKMQGVLEEEWQNRSDSLPYNTPYEALIMASIIEKETGDASERDQIAGVFVRRLQQSMRLQTDPTVIYGLGADFQGNLTRKHLQQSTPYNTYRIKGLPPTPIAMPGREAIHAALHPAPGESLYFVAKGDGTHYFSSTLAEHEQAVREYQIYKRKSDYQSKPKTTGEE